MAMEEEYVDGDYQIWSIYAYDETPDNGDSIGEWWDMPDNLSFSQATLFAVEVYNLSSCGQLSTSSDISVPSVTLAQGGANGLYNQIAGYITQSEWTFVGTAADAGTPYCNWENGYFTDGGVVLTF
jgi:hypothetical protein